MATGAVLASQLWPAVDRTSFDDPNAGPNGVPIRLKSGYEPSTELHSFEQIANATFDYRQFRSDRRMRPGLPPEIVNNRSLGDTPVILGAGLAAAAISALGLALVASVQRRGAHVGDTLASRGIGMRRP